MLVNKPADYLAQVRQQLAGTGRPEDVPIVSNRINDDLLVFYVFDTPDAMRTVMKSDLEEQRLDESSLHSLATRNLGAYFDKHGLTVGRLEDTGRAKIYFVSLDDNYEASVLLLDRYWNKGTFDVAGEIVVFVPARNAVLVTGTEDVEGLRLAREMARTAFERLGYSISPEGYVREVERGSFLTTRRIWTGHP